MSDKAYKRAERKGATAIGTTRTPLSGGASRHTRSDTLHKAIYLEMKYRRRFAVIEQIRKEEVKAKKEKKVAVLGLQQRGLKTRYYLIPEWMMVFIAKNIKEAFKSKGV